MFNNPANLTDAFGLVTQQCTRPLRLKGVPTAKLPPHTLLASTEAKKGAGLGPKEWLGVYSEVPGKIEWEEPYDSSGKVKSAYSCTTVSSKKCVEKCVLKRMQEDTGAPPNYKVGKYQCDNYATDVLNACERQCKNQR